jgi:hypothetical protein
VDYMHQLGQPKMAYGVGEQVNGGVEMIGVVEALDEHVEFVVVAIEVVEDDRQDWWLS